MVNHRINSFDNPLARDLDHILAHTEALWKDLRGRSIFITGGTGFFGCWLLESFCWANIHLNLNATALVLTRDPVAFKKKAPHLASNPAIRFHKGDVKNFTYPKGEFSYIIHAAATSAIESYHKQDPLLKFDTTLEGTRRVLEFALNCRAQKLLFTSSGAVYGSQPPYLQNIPESYTGAPQPHEPLAAWGIAKRCAEFLCSYYANRYSLAINVARCFTFVGPYLPLNIHYAVGNFIKDALSGGPIVINGDGNPYRSYMYAADLAIWLWTILFKADSFAIYNVGSENPVSIKTVAETVAQCFKPTLEVKVMGRPDPAKRNRYVPSTKLAQEKLKLRQMISFKDSIQRTIEYHSQQKRR